MRGMLRPGGKWRLVIQSEIFDLLQRRHPERRERARACSSGRAALRDLEFKSWGLKRIEDARSFRPTPTPNAQKRRNLGIPARALIRPFTRKERARMGTRVRALAFTAIGMTKVVAEYQPVPLPNGEEICILEYCLII